MLLTDARVVHTNITVLATPKRDIEVFAYFDQLDVLADWHANDLHDQVRVSFRPFDVVDVVLVSIDEDLIRVDRLAQFACIHLENIVVAEEAIYDHHLALEPLLQTVQMDVSRRT